MIARHKRLAAVVTFVAAAAVGLLLYYVGGLSDLERSTLSARFSVRCDQHPTGSVLVAIDDKTFPALYPQQRWPFKRRLHAEAVQSLHAAGVKQIVYDVQFSEPGQIDDDLALYDEIGKAGGAALASTVTDGHGGTPLFG